MENLSKFLTALLIRFPVFAGIFMGGVLLIGVFELVSLVFKTNSFSSMSMIVYLFGSGLFSLFVRCGIEAHDDSMVEIFLKRDEIVSGTTRFVRKRTWQMFLFGMCTFFYLPICFFAGLWKIFSRLTAKQEDWSSDPKVTQIRHAATRRMSGR